MPPRRPTRGRHRKPSHHNGPVYVTAATLAAFTVSGLNVPGAIGAARGTATSQSATAASHSGAAAAAAQAGRTIAASQLRRTLVQQQSDRASRLRAARSTMVTQVAAKAAADRKAAEALLPTWVLPVGSYRLTAGFGDVGLWARAHTGQDFAAPTGTPIHAIGDGKIIFAGWDGSYGNKIAIQHTDGTVSWYAHMSEIVVTSGVVKAGEVIGKIGSTGNTTGPHLHLEIRPGNGDPVPPLTWLREHGLKP